MGLQLNPVAAALLVTIIGVTAFFVFHEGEAAESSITEEESEFAGRPLPTIFYKNHTTPLGDDAQRFGREIDSDAAAANITAPAQLIVHPVNATPSPAPRFVPQTSSSSSSSRRSRSSSGGGGNNDNNEQHTPAIEIPVNTTPVNATPPTNTTPVNSTPTNTTAPPTNTTTPPPVNNTNTTVPKPPTNVTNTTNTTNPPPTNSTTPPPVNTTPVNTTPPPPAALTVTLSVESGFPQDQNVVFRCTAEDVTKFEWEFDHGKDLKNTDGTVFHTFPESGTYTVECAAKKGSQEGKATKTVTVTAPKKVTEDYPYGAFITASGEGNTRTFTCEDVGYTAGDFLWRFDGGQYSGTIPGVNFFDAGTKTITHTFPGPGDYDVYCEAASHDERMNKAYWEEPNYSCSSSHGCLLNSATIEVEIEEPEEPEADEEENEEDFDDEESEETDTGSNSTSLNINPGDSEDDEEE